ncbi:DUF2690 domain-containing protein [Kribbella sp. CA-253562]|uniref:DUF2690 domain-containing protein n=1 Tax=Kribbella sp. CA-253562 TaxID=3239942 RepID=UPI003D934F32
MRSPLKRVTGILATLAFAAAGLVATTQPSFAAPPCTYHGCNGKDPQTTGCANGAVTKKELTAYFTKGELRYSPTCHTYWTRITTPSCCGGVGEYATISGGTYDSTGHPRLGAGFRTAVGGGPGWTPMISEAWTWELFCIYTANEDGCLYS